MDSGGQGWGAFVGITFLRFSCDPHSPQGQVTEAPLFTPDLSKAYGPAGGRGLSEMSDLEREINLN